VEFFRRPLHPAGLRGGGGFAKRGLPGERKRLARMTLRQALGSRHPIRPMKRMLRLLLPALLLVAPASAQITPGVTYSGNATTYTLVGEGAGSIPAAHVGTHYAALNGDQWEGSKWCGAWVAVTGPAGTALVQIVDHAPEYASGSLDLGPVPFQEITGHTDGLYPITWQLVSAPGNPGPIRFYSEGSNSFYLKLQAVNLVNALASMEIFSGGSYIHMARTADNHFVHLPGSPIPEPFIIRVTDIHGNAVVSSSLTIAGTSAGQNGSGNFPPVTDPDIVVEYPPGNQLTDGAFMDFGFSVDGAAVTRSFIVRNDGPVPLTGISVTKSGADAADFTVTTPPADTLAPGASTTFVVTFATPVGNIRNAGLHVNSSSAVPALDPFDILSYGRGLSTAADSDLDGMNDGAEALLANFGFLWDVPQSPLVAEYYAHANAAGLYTPAQVQALHLDTPLLQRNPTTGNFTLKLRLRKSTDLVKFEDFAFVPAGLTVNPAGELEFEFSLSDTAAFLKVEAD
jgi:expansin (peptidoglycan-binding protein)